MADGEIDEHVESAHAAGLRYVSDTIPGIRRLRQEEGFAYLDPEGRPVTDEAELDRIRKLVIPPAWTDVWICPTPNGHIQVTARDAKGRKQYRYHPKYREVRDGTKFGPDAGIQSVPAGAPRPGRAGPGTAWPTPGQGPGNGRPAAGEDAHPGGQRRIREGEQVVRADHHASAPRGGVGTHAAVRLPGQEPDAPLDRGDGPAGGADHPALQELPGQELFQYLDDDGRRQTIDAGDINDYLRRISGREVTAKDFRTWAGTMLAAAALRDLGPAAGEKEAKANIVKAVDQVAKRLGNTRAVCRKYYIHPAVIDAYLRGTVLPVPPPPPNQKRLRPSGALRQNEAAVLEFIQEQVTAGSG